MSWSSAPDARLVLVSQQSESQLIKLWLDPTTEQVIGVQAFPLGPADAMLQGLALSPRHPGLSWATHEAGNRLPLVDPGAARLDTPPRIVREINVPGDGRGRHYVGEYGDLLWVSSATVAQLVTESSSLWHQPTTPRTARTQLGSVHPWRTARLFKT